MGGEHPETGEYGEACAVAWGRGCLMNELIDINDTGLVITDANGNPATTSLRVAGVFEREHYNVTQGIRSLECSKEFHGLNFQFVEIIEKNAIGGKVDKSYYTMTRDGFSFLCLGFTGKKAAKFKEDYIAAFNAMEDRLKSLTPALPDFSSPAEAARAWASEYEARQLAEVEKTKAITHAKRLEDENQKARPKVIYYDWVATAPDTMSMGKAAKLMNIKDVGSVNLYRKLRLWGIIMPGGTEPYQKYINQGWLKMEDVTKETSRGVRLFPTTRVTRKGLQKIYGMFLEETQLDLGVGSGRATSLGP